MKNFRWWTVIGLAAAGVALSGCGGSGGDSSGDVSLRVANATLNHASIDLLVDSESTVTATGKDAVSDYASASDGTLTLQINDAEGSTALSTSIRTLSKGNHYTVVAYESGGAVKTAVLSDDWDLPGSGIAGLRIYDAAIEAGSLDIYITTVTTVDACDQANLLEPSTTFATLTAPAAASLTQGAGSYTVCATAAGNKADLRMSLPITVAEKTVVNVIMTPAVGGALINGSVLVQQEDGYTVVRNPNTRVRLAAAASDGTPVTATATASGEDPITIGSGAAPSFGFYKLVKASSALTVKVNGNPVTLLNKTLVAGGDATLLAYVGPGGPTATLIPDDNRPPSNAAATKLRLINGATGNVGTLTLTANSAPVGIEVDVGSASSYQALIGTVNASGNNTFSAELSSSEVGPLDLTNPTIPVSANATYSILAVGDVASQPLRLLVRSNQ